jgi:N-acetylglucosamine-6-phosphate deacetylase
VSPAASYTQQRVHYSIIVDGIHCHKYSASMVHRLHPAGLVLITDAMAAMGLKPGAARVSRLRVSPRRLALIRAL